MDSLIPASKISNLTRGMLVGAVFYNFDERPEQKIFHYEIVVDNAKVAAENNVYEQIPDCPNFIDANGNDLMKKTIQANYNRIKAEATQIVADEIERIKGNETLKHLII